MIFEIGKKYIVDVTEKGITPLMEFDEDRWFDKDHDDLDFLTDEEKVIVINAVLDMIRTEIEALSIAFTSSFEMKQDCLEILDKYKGASERICQI